METDTWQLPASAREREAPLLHRIKRAAPLADLAVRPGRRSPFLVTILLLFFALTSIHELSPYIVALQLMVLAAARPLRPRWLPLALLAIAVAYLLPRLSFVNSHYGLLGSFGSFFGNAAPPSSSSSSYAGSIPASQLLIQHCADALSVLMWLLALVGAWRLRHSGRIVLALLVLTFSPILVLFGQAYGNEGLLRVYLFSLPWAAAWPPLRWHPDRWPAPRYRASGRPRPPLPSDLQLRARRHCGASARPRSPRPPRWGP